MARRKSPGLFVFDKSSAFNLHHQTTILLDMLYTGEKARVGGGGLREYFIYKLKEEVAEQYFGKESKLFQLFLEEYKTFTAQKNVLQKQIEYITSPLHIDPLQTFLKQMLLSKKGFHTEVHSFLLESDNSSARLSFSDRYLILQSVGGFEAETIIFETMRKYERCFFAMDFKYYRYGWLNPLKAKTGYGS